MGRYCLVCCKMYKAGVDRSFHQIPKKESVKIEWLKRLKTVGIALKHLKEYKTCYVCSDHFDPDCFVQYSNGNRFLRTNSVPVFSVSSASLSSTEEDDRRLTVNENQVTEIPDSETETCSDLSQSPQFLNTCTVPAINTLYVSPSSKEADDQRFRLTDNGNQVTEIYDSETESSSDLPQSLEFLRTCTKPVFTAPCVILPSQEVADLRLTYNEKQSSEIYDSETDTCSDLSRTLTASDIDIANYSYSSSEESDARHFPKKVNLSSKETISKAVNSCISWQNQTTDNTYNIHTTPFKRWKSTRCSGNCSTNENVTSNQLLVAKQTIKKLRKKVNSLQQSNRRLKKRVVDLRVLLKQFKKEHVLLDKALSFLKAKY